MCESQHDLTHPLPVQVEQLYHNINTWRTACKVMQERYGAECAALGMSVTLTEIEAECETLAQKAVALYQKVVSMQCVADEVTNILNSPTVQVAT